MYSFCFNFHFFEILKTEIRLCFNLGEYRTYVVCKSVVKSEINKFGKYDSVLFVYIGILPEYAYMRCVVRSIQFGSCLNIINLQVKTAVTMPILFDFISYILITSDIVRLALLYSWDNVESHSNLTVSYVMMFFLYWSIDLFLFFYALTLSSPLSYPSPSSCIFY